MAWSGDIFQQNQSSGTDLRFVIPAEGGTIWTDNMLIPKYAANPVGAMMLMDWHYRPAVAAMLTTGISYVTAVPSVRALISARARAATGRARRTLTGTGHQHARLARPGHLRAPVPLRERPWPAQGRVPVDLPADRGELTPEAPAGARHVIKEVIPGHWSSGRGTFLAEHRRSIT
jgi:spermidine/putrescine transport system substrate-binding protein